MTKREYKCKVCGRKLTSLESIKRGAGIACAVHSFENMPRSLQLAEYDEYRKVRVKMLEEKKLKEQKKKLSVRSVPRIVNTHYGLEK